MFTIKPFVVGIYIEFKTFIKFCDGFTYEEYSEKKKILQYLIYQL